MQLLKLLLGILVISLSNIKLITLKDKNHPLSLIKKELQSCMAFLKSSKRSKTLFPAIIKEKGKFKYF